MRAALVLALCGATLAPRAAQAEILYYYDEDTEGIGPPSDFSLLGSAWNSGPNSARLSTATLPGSATFSIMGAGFVDASGFDSSHGANTTSDITALNVPGLTFNDYRDMINQALSMWDAVSGFTNLGYVADGDVDAGASQASGGQLGDIRVTAWEITTTGVLGHSFQPGTEANFGPGGTIAGDVHLDVSRSWVDSPTAALPDIDLFSVLLHETGHALGLAHSTFSGSVMEAVYTGSRRTLTNDDIAGIQALYGVPEPSAFVLLLSAAGMLLVWRVRCGTMLPSAH